jgi:hypothetical protein
MSSCWGRPRHADDTQSGSGAPEVGARFGLCNATDVLGSRLPGAPMLGEAQGRVYRSAADQADVAHGRTTVPEHSGMIDPSEGRREAVQGEKAITRPSEPIAGVAGRRSHGSPKVRIRRRPLLRIVNVQGDGASTHPATLAGPFRSPVWCLRADMALPPVRSLRGRCARGRHARAPRAAGSRRASSGSRLLRDRSRHEY